MSTYQHTNALPIPNRLENSQAQLLLLEERDFEDLYAVASDPLIWEQHPNRDRWKREVFQSFFEGALQSGGAYKIIDKAGGKVAGSTRIYDYDSEQNIALIGYTFYARAYWGTGMNAAVKALLLDYLFQYVGEVHFHIGADNTRSQIAIGRIGAVKVGEKEIAYFGEPEKRNFIYSITREAWEARKG